MKTLQFAFEINWPLGWYFWLESKCDIETVYLNKRQFAVLFIKRIVKKIRENMLWAHYKSVILADQQLPKLELKNYSKNVLTTPMFFKELRSWRLNNLIDYISGKRKARKDLTKPKLKILSEVKGKYKSKINQMHASVANVYEDVILSWKPE